MIILFSKIVGSPIKVRDDEIKIGNVKDVIYKLETFEISALLIANLFPPFSHQKAVSAVDIIEISNNGVIINKSSAALPLAELPVTKRFFKDGLHGTGQDVITENKKRIGTVYDFTVDTDTMSITSLYIRNLFSERIIPTRLVIDFEKNRFKIKNEFDNIEIAVAQAAVQADI